MRTKSREAGHIYFLRGAIRSLRRLSFACPTIVLGPFVVTSFVYRFLERIRFMIYLAQQTRSNILYNANIMS